MGWGWKATKSDWCLKEKGSKPQHLPKSLKVKGCTSALPALRNQSDIMRSVFLTTMTWQIKIGFELTFQLLMVVR
jgi:hypothetical protein